MKKKLNKIQLATIALVLKQTTANFLKEFEHDNTEKGIKLKTTIDEFIKDFDTQLANISNDK